MKVHYDGLNVSFTPESPDDQRLLVGFCNLDAVIDKVSDSASFSRMNVLNADYGDDITKAIVLLSDEVASDSTFNNPPEDEDDDDIPTPVPRSID